MKKFLVLFVLGAFIFAAAGEVFAGQGGINSNQSAEWCKTLSRTGSTEVDATYFNPAGTALMEEGFYLSLSNQTIYQPIEVRGHSLTKNVYKGTKIGWYFPVGYMALVKKLGFGKLALSGAMQGIGGGGSAAYNQGLPYLDAALATQTGTTSTFNSVFSRLGFSNQTISGIPKTKFTGGSAFYSLAANIALSFMEEKLAVSIGGRAIYGDEHYKARVHMVGNAYGTFVPLSSNFYSHRDGMSWGIILGISAKPIKDLTIGFKAEYYGTFVMTVDKVQDDLLLKVVDPSMASGGQKHMQLPINWNLGFKYTVGKLNLWGSFHHYLVQFTQRNGKEKHFEPFGSWEVAAGLDYDVIEPLNIGLGYQYSQNGSRNSINTQLSEELDSHSVGLGLTYKVNKHISLTLAQLFTYYVPQEVNAGTQYKLFKTYFHKISFDTAIGITTKI